MKEKIGKRASAFSTQSSSHASGILPPVLITGVLRYSDVFVIVIVADEFFCNDEEQEALESKPNEMKFGKRERSEAQGSAK